MATKYTSFIWPPLLFPLPVFTGKGGFLAARPNWPPMVFPLPTFRGKVGGIVVQGAAPKMVLPAALAARTSKVATPAAPPMPSMVAPAKTVSKTSFTPVAPPALPSPSSIVPASVTAAAISSYFRIINGTSIPALQDPIPSPPPPVNPDT